MMILRGLGSVRRGRRPGLFGRGLGDTDTSGNWSIFNPATWGDNPSPEDPGEIAGSGFFDNIASWFNGTDPCAGPGTPMVGSECWQRQHAATSGDPGTPSPPIGWQTTVGNLISGIQAGFFPSSGPKPVVATMPVTVVVPQPWYKTPLGMVGIAVAGIGAAYYAMNRK